MLGRVKCVSSPVDNECTESAQFTKNVINCIIFI